MIDASIRLIFTGRAAMFGSPSAKKPIDSLTSQFLTIAFGS